MFSDRQLQIVVLIILVLIIICLIVTKLSTESTTSSSSCVSDAGCKTNERCQNNICIPIFDIPNNPIEIIDPVEPPPTPLCELSSRDLDWELVANQTLLNLTTYNDYPVTFKLPTSRKIIMASRGSIMKLNLDGTADVTFAVNGIYTEVNILLLGYDFDENLYISHSFSGVRKLKAVDGSIDPTFGSGGVLTLTSPIGSLFTGIRHYITLSQNINGSLYLLSRLSNGRDYPYISKFSTDGVLDTSFGINGHLTISEVPNVLNLIGPYGSAGQMTSTQFFNR